MVIVWSPTKAVFAIYSLTLGGKLTSFYYLHLGDVRSGNVVGLDQRG